MILVERLSHVLSYRPQASYCATYWIEPHKIIIFRLISRRLFYDQLYLRVKFVYDWQCADNPDNPDKIESGGVTYTITCG